MKYFFPVKLIDFGEYPSISKLNKVANADFRLNELFRMVRWVEMGNPRAIIGWKSLNFYLFPYFCLHSGFTIVRTVQHMKNPEGTAAIMAANFTWIAVIGFSYIPYHAFVLRKQETEQLLKSWNMLEQELLPGKSFWAGSVQFIVTDSVSLCFTAFDPEDVLVRALLNNQKRRLKFAFLVDLTVVIMGTALLVWNGFGTPRLAVYFYSLMPPGVESEWLKYASILFQCFYVSLVVNARAQSDLLHYSFTQSIKIYVQLIDPHNRNEKQIFDAKATERALHQYAKICALVEQFNATYRWPLLFSKGLGLLYISLCAVPGFRKPSELPDSFSPVYVAGSAFIALRTAMIIHSMAMTYRDSELFIHRMMEDIALATAFDENLWQKVNVVRAIGFQMGKLYIMRPITFFTYFSVIMSNLIVVLQIKQN